ncbi:PREDICTED: uncharacterized protein LOC109240047 [Nicotiana attenuata]|uniref:Uncharacterized protein n=1 Tax=Nicotiana attenuata TaxID=49451 RepID=A0A314L8I9_NICAT|nr:PREDICTED: uncharacterized protein LOC109240047 [Nicotiana attenuata]OIT37970.1 hypothetical protein A4A49_54030 [Nicotiana attenuata]
MKRFNTTLLVFLGLVVVCCVQPGKGSRLLHEKELMKLQSLQRGPVPPSGPSGCTNIPGNGGSGSGCPLNEMHFAGRHVNLLRATSAYPTSLMVHFGVAVNRDEALL